jgi:hypothetical protein
LTAIFKPDWSTLDYIEYPNEKWYLTEKGDELYVFDNGIFIAHSMVDEDVFHKAGVVKVLPETAEAIEVEITGAMQYMSTNLTNGAPKHGEE